MLTAFNNPNNLSRVLLLQAIPATGAVTRRQNSSTGDLDDAGQIHASHQQASAFNLRKGRLYSGSEQVSVGSDVSSFDFETSLSVETFDTVFGVIDDMLCYL